MSQGELGIIGSYDACMWDVETEALRVQGHPHSVCMASLRPAWATCNFVSKPETKQTKNTNTKEKGFSWWKKIYAALGREVVLGISGGGFIIWQAFWDGAGFGEDGKGGLEWSFYRNSNWVEVEFSLDYMKPCLKKK